MRLNLLYHNLKISKNNDIIKKLGISQQDIFLNIF